MKKVLFRAEAVFLAVAVFFCSVVYKPIKVEAAALGGSIVQNILWSIGVGLVSDYAKDKIADALGWSDTEIKTDSEGNVIISPEQVEEIKAAAEDVVFAENGCYLYKSTATKNYRQYVADCNYSESDSWYVDNPIPLVSDYTPRPTWIKDHTRYWDERFIIEKPYYYVAGVSQTDIQTFDNSGNLVSGISYYGYDGSWNKHEAYASAVGGTDCYYGQDLIVFNNEESLQNYLGLPDEEKPFLMPVTNPDGTVSNDNKIPAYDPGTGTVIEIDFTYDDSMDLVFTPEGYLYLNYTDIDQDGIPDDHDDDIPASDVDTSGMKETILFEDTVNGWSSGNVQLSDDWTNYDFLSFSFGSSHDGGYGSNGTSSSFVSTSDFLSSGIFLITFYFRRGFEVKVNSEDYTTLICNRRFADNESSDAAPIVYVIKGYKVSSGSSGGGTVDLTDTNNYLDGINNTLDEILKWVKKIYNQVVLGNIIEGADLLNDLFQQELDDLSALGEIAQTKFPFSLAVDILAILTILEAEPQAPVFEIPFRADFGGATGISVDEVFVLDFTMFEDAVEVLRWWLSIMWIFALVWMTPRFLDVGGDLTGGGKK